MLIYYKMLESEKNTLGPRQYALSTVSREHPKLVRMGSVFKCREGSLEPQSGLFSGVLLGKPTSSTCRCWSFSLVQWDRQNDYRVLLKPCFPRLTSLAAVWTQAVEVGLTAAPGVPSVAALTVWFCRIIESVGLEKAFEISKSNFFTVCFGRAARVVPGVPALARSWCVSVIS